MTILQSPIPCSPSKSSQQFVILLKFLEIFRDDPIGDALHFNADREKYKISIELFPGAKIKSTNLVRNFQVDEKFHPTRKKIDL